MEDVFEEESCDLEEVMARHQAMEEELEREELRQMELNILPEHENEAEAVVEAVLFTMGGSVTLKQLATALDLSLIHISLPTKPGGLCTLTWRRS